LFSFGAEFFGRYPAAKGTKILSPPAFAKLFPEELTQFKRQIDAYVNDILLNVNTYVRFSDHWTRQTLGNLSMLIHHPSFYTLRDAFRGLPAVVVSPGPSLDKNIHQLAAHQDRFLIFSPSQSLKVLTHAGIRPHFVLVADSQELSFHFAQIPAESYRNLILLDKCHPSVMRIPAVHRFFCNMAANHFAREIYRMRGEQPIELSYGYSVSNMAVNLALFMGAGPVILMGQDLAFSGDKMYASQAHGGDRQLEYFADGQVFSLDKVKSRELPANGANPPGPTQVSKVIWVKGQNGEMLPTLDMYWAMQSWLERLAETLQGRHQLINATEGGALIQGFEHIPFLEVVRRHAAREPVEVDQRLAEVPPVAAEHIERAHTYLRGLVVEFAALARVAKDCDDMAERCANTPPNRPALLARMEKRDLLLTQGLQKHMVIENMVQQAMSQYRRMGDPKKEDLAANLQRSRLLYQAIIRSCGDLVTLIEGQITGKGANP